MRQLYYVIRTLLRGRGANLIKIISLGLGLTMSILLFARVAYELSFDSCYHDSEQLHQVFSIWTTNGEQSEAYPRNIRVNNQLKTNYSMIQINDISKVFRTSEVETVALNHVNLDIAEGEFVAIMGPSGCGKSTLLNILGLLDNPTEGSYQLLGEEIAGLKEKQRTQVRKGKLGFVFQSFNLIDELNVYENVELPLTYLGFKASERRRMVDDILKRMNISHRAKHFPQQLSGGQQQRVAIARAVVTNPRLILADEPTGNLDSKNGVEVMNLLTELNKEGTTIVMVTHSQHDASFAHRTVHLFDGSVVASVASSI